MTNRKKGILLSSFVFIVLLGFLVSMGALPVVITISSTPDSAEIFIDGEPIGKTPLYTFLIPGDHTIEGAIDDRSGFDYCGNKNIRNDAYFFKEVNIELQQRRFNSPSLDAQFTYVPPGEIIDVPSCMQTSSALKYDIKIEKEFYIQVTEITQKQWKKIMDGKNPSHFAYCDDCPVEQVSWHDVQVFVEKLNAQEKIGKYRLPTSAEWEYSARVSTIASIESSHCLDASMANITGGFQCPRCMDGNNLLPNMGTYGKRTTPVASIPPNKLGLYGMDSNVWEWSNDASSGYTRTVKGGGLDIAADRCRFESTTAFAPEDRFSHVGFRLVWEEKHL